MVDNLASVALTQQQVSDAMRGIREAISSNEAPNTDVLELTEKVPSDEQDCGIASEKKTEVAKEDPFISILDDALNKKGEFDEGLIKPQIINKSQDVMRQFIDATSKKSSVDKREHSALEALVIDALKPHLSVWLNNHLPEIVQNIVEKEIKKLVP